MILSNSFCVKGSSDDFIDANIQLAVAVVRKLKERKGTRVCIVRRDYQTTFLLMWFFVLLTCERKWMLMCCGSLQVFPDQPEKRRASELFKSAFDLVTINIHVLGTCFYMIFFLCGVFGCLFPKKTNFSGYWFCFSGWWYNHRFLGRCSQQWPCLVLLQIH